MTITTYVVVRIDIHRDFDNTEIESYAGIYGVFESYAEAVAHARKEAQALKDSEYSDGSVTSLHMCHPDKPNDDNISEIVIYEDEDEDTLVISFKIEKVKPPEKT